MVKERTGPRESVAGSGDFKAILYLVLFYPIGRQIKPLSWSPKPCSLKTMFKSHRQEPVYLFGPTSLQCVSYSDHTHQKPTELPSHRCQAAPNVPLRRVPSRRLRSLNQISIVPNSDNMCILQLGREFQKLNISPCLSQPSIASPAPVLTYREVKAHI